MAQVQLYLAKSQYGYNGLGNINPSEEVVRNIKDFSAALDSIEYDASRPDVFYLIKYIEDGLLLTLLRPVKGAPGNHYAATLFFPLGLKIEKEQFLDIVAKIKSVIAEGTDPGNEDVAELRRLLSTDYGIDESKAHFRESQGTGVAIVFTDGPKPVLGDFFDVRFYQPEYANYSGVLLVDRLSGAKARPDSHELSGDLKEIYTVLPPKGALGGFLPHVFHEPFRRPILAAKDSVIDIVWRRNGFESITRQMTVGSDRMTAPVCDTSAARKLLTNTSFYVTEQSSCKLVKEFSVKVNGIDINGPTPFTFSELSHANVVITAPGYVNFTSDLDLASSAQALVQMRKLHKSYRFDMPLLTPEPLEPLRIYIKTLKPLTRCPIEGYVVAGGEMVEGGASNSLYYVGKQSQSRTLIGIAALVGALLIGFFIGWLVFKGDAKDKEPVPTAKVEETTPAPAAPAVTVTPQETPEETAAPVEAPQPEVLPEVLPEPQPAPEVLDYKAATDYLENNKNWLRTDMEAIPALRGLFDDMNTYNFERIKTHWAPLLKDSRRFNAVVEAAAGSATKRDPRTGTHTPTYSPENEGTINWRQYTYWVDP